MGDIKPALTEEEWKGGRIIGIGLVIAANENAVTVETPCGTNTGHCSVFSGEGRKGLAALCLHEQEFGFTREDVDILEQACVIEFFDGGGVDEDPDAAKVLSSLAARLKALLPPEE